MQVVQDAKGEVTLLKVEADLEGSLKPKGRATWASRGTVLYE
jgi:hypothetical protein